METWLCALFHIGSLLFLSNFVSVYKWWPSHAVEYRLRLPQCLNENISNEIDFWARFTDLD